MFNSLSLLFPGWIITVWPRDPNAPAVLGDKADPLGGCVGTCAFIFPSSAITLVVLYTYRP